jgi:hypothetical protein
MAGSRTVCLCGEAHNVKVQTGAPNGLHMWYRCRWTYKRVGLRGRGEEQWLAWIIDWAPHQGSVDDTSCSDVQQSFDLLWVQVTIFAECKKVSGYSLFQEGTTNAAEKEPIEALVNLWRLTGIVFRIKATSWRNVYENLYRRTTLGSKAIDSA